MSPALQVETGAAAPSGTAGLPAARASWLAWAPGMTLLAVFAFVYAPVFAALGRVWWESDVHRHGFVVPLIALYLAWARREELRGVAVVPSPLWGGLTMGVAALMLLVGKAAAAVLLEEVSLLVMVTGLVLLFRGGAQARALALPIAYLTFMVPIFAEGADWIHWPFQLLAAHIGIGLLQGIGVPAFQQAQYIELPRITLEVAEACSGIRFMISVIAIGIPLAYLTQRTWVRRVGLVLFAVVIGILANGTRVAFIGVWAYHGGEVVHGPLHVFQAMFVAWIGYVALFVGAWGLRRWPSR
jgi:exosortase